MMSFGGLLLKQETEREGNEAGQASETPDHGALKDRRAIGSHTEGGGGRWSLQGQKPGGWGRGGGDGRWIDQ